MMSWIKHGCAAKPSPMRMSIRVGVLVVPIKRDNLSSGMDGCDEDMLRPW
jgi:hypothetical protein